jgi:hypothetical protein
MASSKRSWKSPFAAPRFRYALPPLDILARTIFFALLLTTERSVLVARDVGFVRPRRFLGVFEDVGRTRWTDRGRRSHIPHIQLGHCWAAMLCQVRF